MHCCCYLTESFGSTVRQRRVLAIDHIVVEGKQLVIIKRVGPPYLAQLFKLQVAAVTEICVVRIILVNPKSFKVLKYSFERVFTLRESELHSFFFGQSGPFSPCLFQRS